MKTLSRLTEPAKPGSTKDGLGSPRPSRDCRSGTAVAVSLEIIVPYYWCARTGHYARVLRNCPARVGKASSPGRGFPLAGAALIAAVGAPLPSPVTLGWHTSSSQEALVPPPGAGSNSAPSYFEILCQDPVSSRPMGPPLASCVPPLLVASDAVGCLSGVLGVCPL